MHLAQVNNASGEKERPRRCLDEDEGENQVDQLESSPQSRLLRCPFNPCDRSQPYSNRGNLTRHFQTRMCLVPWSSHALTQATDVECYELCPVCGESFVKVHQYLRHSCKSSPEDPRSIIKERRSASLYAAVSKQLDEWEVRSRTGSKREFSDSVSLWAPKRIKTASAPALEGKAPWDPSAQVSHSTVTIGEVQSNSIRQVFTDSRTGYQALNEKMPTVDLNNDDLHYPSGRSVDGQGMLNNPANDIAANNEWDLGEWAFTPSTFSVRTSDDLVLNRWEVGYPANSSITDNEPALGEWAFAVTDLSASTANSESLT